MDPQHSVQVPLGKMTISQLTEVITDLALHLGSNLDQSKLSFADKRGHRYLTPDDVKARKVPRATYLQQCEELRAMIMERDAKEGTDAIEAPAPTATNNENGKNKKDPELKGGTGRCRARQNTVGAPIVETITGQPVSPDPKPKRKHVPDPKPAAKPPDQPDQPKDASPATDLGLEPSTRVHLIKRMLAWGHVFRRTGKSEEATKLFGADLDKKEIFNHAELDKLSDAELQSDHDKLRQIMVDFDLMASEDQITKVMRLVHRANDARMRVVTDSKEQVTEYRRNGLGDWRKTNPATVRHVIEGLEKAGVREDGPIYRPPRPRVTEQPAPVPAPSNGGGPPQPVAQPPAPVAVPEGQPTDVPVLPAEPAPAENQPPKDPTASAVDQPDADGVDDDDLPEPPRFNVEEAIVPITQTAVPALPAAQPATGGVVQPAADDGKPSEATGGGAPSPDQTAELDKLFTQQGDELRQANVALAAAQAEAGTKDEQLAERDRRAGELNEQVRSLQEQLNQKGGPDMASTEEDLKQANRLLDRVTDQLELKDDQREQIPNAILDLKREKNEAGDKLQRVTAALAAVPGEGLTPDNVVQKYGQEVQDKDAAEDALRAIKEKARQRNKIDLAGGIVAGVLIIGLIITSLSGRGGSSTPPAAAESGDTEPFDYADLVPEPSAADEEDEDELSEQEG